MAEFTYNPIQLVEPNQNVKSRYFLKKDHSSECKELEKNIKISKKENYKKKDEFIKLCEDVMNTSTIYDRNLYKTKFKEIYNSNYYDFPINNNMLSNIITKWKNSTYKFKKECAQYNLYDYQNRLLLRDYRSIFLELPNK